MTSLYIHIPFCKKKCSYCDFVSYAGKEDLIEKYVECLVNEIHCWDLESGNLGSVYFGGGTPTLLKPKHFENIINTLIGHWSFDICHSEVSVEANPGTVDKEYLAELRRLGINRISFGAQSFNDKHLRLLGRIHNSKQIFKAVEDARSAGFENINLDLIFAIPNQTLDEWKDDLKQAISLEPEHLSTYNLQIEEGTPLWYQINPHPLTPSPIGRGGTNDWFSPLIKVGEGLAPISEDLDADMYEFTIDYLTSHSYKHYEISNFAKPAFECKHNINYWQNENYIGIGCGAHSHVDGRRRANTDNVEAYIGSGGRNVIRPTSDDSHDATDRRETLFMGLRLTDGLPAEKFKGFEDKVESLTKDGLLSRNNGNIKLTRKGLLLGNLVFEKFV